MANPVIPVQRIHRHRPILFTRRFWQREAIVGYLFISPWLIGFLLLGLWPLCQTFQVSLTNADLYNPPVSIGFQNYRQLLFKDTIFHQITINMLIYVTASTCITVGGGLLFALILNRKFPVNRLFRLIIYIPGLLVGVASALLFRFVFSPDHAGLANAILNSLNLPTIKWLMNYNAPILGLIGLILVNLWFVGNTMLIFLAGLNGLSSAYYEAARIDGANPWHRFRYITLPLLSPVILFNILMSLIGHIQVFETPLIFAVGGSGSVNSNSNNPLGYHNSLGTFLTYLYVQAFSYNHFGYGAAIAIVTFLITLLFTLLLLGIFRKFTYYAGEYKD